MNIDKSKIIIRIAERNNWEKILDIYNQAVLEGDKTADLDTVTLGVKSEWLKLHSSGKYQILLAEIEDQTLGWCSISPHRPGRRALENTAEISYYIDKKYRGNGVGSILIKSAIETSKENGIKNLFAILLDVNKPSVSILKKFGFKKWGHLPKVAEIRGRTCGQFIYGKHL
jgi:phosphinothricin acetyltransferase